MPVCVIRVGDFIHTRAIINSMTISYAAANGLVWDLNSEGAGVQPMYAKISLTITLLGGQSLGAPISRLQNAISFNYYANAESYDNRADVATYEKRENGDSYVAYKRIWTPLNPGDEIDTTNNMVWESTVEKKEGKSQDNVQNETFKEPTEEQIAEKLNPQPETSGSTSGGTSGETGGDEIVKSPEMTEWVNHQAIVGDILDEFFAPAEGYPEPFVSVKCNKSYVESNYAYSEYKQDCISYHVAGELPVVINDMMKQRIYDELDGEVMAAIKQFRDTHNGSSIRPR